MAFQTYEIENEFLFQLSSKSTIEAILNKVLYSVQMRGECLIPIDACNTLTLKLFPSLPIPPSPEDYEVPIMIKNLETLQYGIMTNNGYKSMDDNNWDLALRILLPYINGINYIKQISIYADVDITIVKKVIQNLIHYGCVKLVDIFQYSNIYATTPQLSDLLLNDELRAIAIKYISNDDNYIEEIEHYNQILIQQQQLYSNNNIGGSTTNLVPEEDEEMENTNKSQQDITTNDQDDDKESVTSSVTSYYSTVSNQSRNSTNNPHQISTFPPKPFTYPSFDYVFRLYTSFGAGARVCDICVQYNTIKHHIDDRRLLRFGILYGILKRIHKYPIKSIYSPNNTNNASIPTTSTFQAMPALPLPLANNNLSSSIGTITSNFTIPTEILNKCDGTLSIEAICVELGMPQTIIERTIDSLGDYVYILR